MITGYILFLNLSIVAILGSVLPEGEVFFKIKEPEDENENHQVLCTEQGDEISIDCLNKLQHQRGNTLGTRKVVKENILWPEGKVYWRFASRRGRRFDDQVSEEMIRMGMAFWQSKTCLVFIEVSEAYDKPCLSIGAGRGCASMIGYKSLVDQPIYLREPGCLGLGTIEHEIGHALGFYHEQARTDRDGSIKVNFNNIKEQFLENFEKVQASQNILPYDVSSDMHYGKKYFAKSKTQTTIHVLDENLEFIVGQRYQLSFYDIWTANKAYKCQERCHVDLICQNGGFMVVSSNGIDCNCMCPDGLEGKYCETLDKKETKECGDVLELVLHDKIELSSPNYPNFYPHIQCTWMIKSPFNTSMHVDLYVKELPENDEYHYCNHWVEIRYNLPGQDGPRFCGTKQRNILVSTGNIVILRFNGYRKGYFGYGFIATVTVIPAVSSVSINYPEAFGHTIKTNENTSRCGLNICRENEKCVFEYGSPICACQTGYSGHLCQLLSYVNCTFDKKTLCIFDQSFDDTFDWTLNKGETPSFGTGPSDDVSGNGYYIYTEISNDVKFGDVAILKSVLVEQGQKCVEFWYHMYGEYINQLIVEFKIPNSKWIELWEKKSDQGIGWHRAVITIKSAKPFVIFLIGHAGYYQSDVAIDSFSIATGACPDSIVTTYVLGEYNDISEEMECDSSWCFNGGTCKNFLDVMCDCLSGFVGEFCQYVANATCTFDEFADPDDLCIFSVDKSSSLEWHRAQGETPTPFTGPSADVSKDGYYIYVEASKMTFQTEVGVGRLISLDIAAGEYCFSFHRHMYGRDVGVLQLTLETVESFDSKYVTEKFMGNQNNTWIAERLSVTSFAAFRIVIEVYVVEWPKADVAIDEVLIREEACVDDTGYANLESQTIVLRKTGEFSCTFDVDLCGFVNIFDSPKVWVRTEQEPIYGPYGDHTTGSGKFIKDNLKEAFPGDFITIISPVIRISQQGCLRFWHYAFGYNLGLLEAVCRYGKKEYIIWAKKGILFDEEWHLQIQTFTLTTKNSHEDVQIMFRLTVLDSAWYSWGNHAVDDISVSSGAC